MLPNPATDQVNFTLDDAATIEQIELFDMFGHSVRCTNQPNAQPVSIQGLPPSWYLAKITAKDGSTGLTKFVKL